MNELNHNAAKDTDTDAGAPDWAALAMRIKSWGQDLGLGAVGISDLVVDEAAQGLSAWIEQGFHGDMGYMARHAHLRAQPSALVPGACRAIVARLDYRPRHDHQDWVGREWQRIAMPGAAVVSKYARGRDYHKVLRHRLQQLANKIESAVQAEGGYRVFADSAPVMEVTLACKGGLGWRGKHTLLLTRDAGSMFFIGEILTSLPLPVDAPVTEHCGQCTRCIEVCPTGAIIAPYQLDARRCISYLTIEHPGAIPEDLRPHMGNRIYGCDDCQLICPWNKFAQVSKEADFDVRNGLDNATLVSLFEWCETDFLERFAGSPIRRIGYERWLRNLAVALGNAPTTPSVVAALQARADHVSELVRAHVAWALAQHKAAV